MSAGMQLTITLLTAVGTGLLGYWIGAKKTAKEHQMKMYEDALPSLLKFTLDPTVRGDTAAKHAFNRALSSVLLYSSKEVAKKTDLAVNYLTHPDRGDFLAAMQNLIIEMRKDIYRSWPRRRKGVSKGDIEHFYVN